MEHVCENCGTIFEGAPQARFHDDACRKAYARRPPELSMAEEQEIRLRWGYAASESRTRAERQAVADRIGAKIRGTV